MVPLARQEGPREARAPRIHHPQIGSVVTMSLRDAALALPELDMSTSFPCPRMISWTQLYSHGITILTSAQCLLPSTEILGLPRHVLFQCNAILSQDTMLWRQLASPVATVLPQIGS